MADNMLERQNLNPNDLSIFNRFNCPSIAEVTDGPDIATITGTNGNLADLIIQKINAWEETHDNEADKKKQQVNNDSIEIPVKVIEVYSKYGSAVQFYIFYITAYMFLGLA